MTPKIFIFLNAAPTAGWFDVVAFSEDGHILAGHNSSNLHFAKMDIGLEPGTFWDQKHEVYKKHYPDGYELEWIEREDLKSHEGFQKAFHIYQSRETEPAQA